ncbi:hypothetical protein, partial [Rhodococcus triatomae]
AAPDGRAGARRTPTKLALAGGIGVLAVAVIGTTVWSNSGDGEQPADTAVATTASPDEDTLPILDLPDPTPTTTAASSEVDDTCRADRGDQNSGAGVIAAFNHAYYAQRNAAAARALATPNSTIVPADQLQPFIDAVPPGTNYCVAITPLSGTAYAVDLTELRPEGAQRIPQTITTKKVDGRWFIDVVT